MAETKIPDGSEGQDGLVSIPRFREISLSDLPDAVVTQAARYNVGKLRWSLIDWGSMEDLVRVLEMGANKYAPDNWKRGLHREEILESTMRHLVSLFMGEEFDPESQLPHEAHIKCNMMFLSYHRRHKSFSKERNNPFKNK